jgi:hypothetical protein
MAKLKTFVTESGFFELAVAAPSMKAALRAWDFTHDAFAQGRARQTQDAAIIAAATAVPGAVLKRPIGGKGAFQTHAELPQVKGKAAKKIKQRKQGDHALKAAEAALRKAEAAHEQRAQALQKQRDTLDSKIAEEEQNWTIQRDRLRSAVRKAG